MPFGFGLSLPQIGSLSNRFTPASLFVNGEQGAWYDPSDLTTLFQDAAGTTPVTAVEQPVGLMLDKSKGLVLGSDLKGIGTLQSIGSVTAATYNTTTGVGTSVRVDATNQSWVRIAVTASTFYRVNISNTGASSLLVRDGGSGGALLLTVSSGTTVVAYLSSSLGSFDFAAATNGTTASYTITTVQQLPGNHAFQSTSAARPVLSARVNLLTKTEQFDDAAWTKTGVTVTPNTFTAPDGTLTADLMTGGGNWFAQVSALPGVANQQLIASIWVYPPAGVTSLTIRIDRSGIAQGNQTVKTVTPETWQRVTHTATLDANTASPVLRVDLSGGTSLTVWGADLRTANDGVGIPAYQRVNTSTNYDTAGFPLYIKPNGSSQWMQTNSIDFSATDKMTVVAGVRKLSDAVNYGVVSELGADAPSGSFTMLAPHVGATYSWLSKGTSGAYAVTGTTYASPTTNIISGIGNISGDSSILRINGIQAAEKTDDQGTGNFGNYPLYLFARGGSSLWFNGRFYGLIARGAQSSAAQISSTEAWMNQKTKAY